MTQKIETFTFQPLTFSASERSCKGFMQQLSCMHLPESASKRVFMKCGGKKEKCTHYSCQLCSLSGGSHQLLTLEHFSRTSLSLTVSTFCICLSIFLPLCNTVCSSSVLLNVIPVEPLYLLQNS